MTIRDKTALIETGPKPKRRVEPSEEITERKDKLFNLSQNESQRISQKSADSVSQTSSSSTEELVGPAAQEKKRWGVKLKEKHML